ncbi:MAG: Crp/Fnr family transcriptional regulator [Cytophagales bacterium]|nr:Crp/Fnr family transcriptional regulator [Cytophagales bacterium]
MRHLIDIPQLLERGFGSFKQYEPGDRLYSEGDLYVGVFFIIDGRIQIQKKGPSKKMTMWFGESGEFTGVVALFDDQKLHSSTAVVIESTAQIFHFSKKQFLEFLNKHPEVQKDVIKKLCQKINLTEMRIFNSILHNNRTRFIDTLMFLSNQENSYTNETSGKNVVVKCSEDTLSELSGISKKYLSRLLEEFESNKLLKIQKSQFIINDFEEFRLSK